MTSPAGVTLHFDYQFQDLSTNELFPDVVLACQDGVKVPCHRVVLAAHSQVRRERV